MSAPVQEPPAFKHDCDRCIYLGRMIDREGRHDLYFCADPSWGFHTVLARFGDEGSHYRSFSVDSNTIKLFEREPAYPLSVAYRAACDAGYFAQKT